MILTTLAHASQLETLHPLFSQLFDYLRHHDLCKAAAGRIVLDGDKLFINIDEPQLRSREEQKLEVHRRYIDVHIPLSGPEIVGWTPLEELKTHSEQPFDEEHDFALYAEPAKTYFTAQPGDIYFMFPEDAHAPIIGDGTMKKAICKVRID